MASILVVDDQLVMRNMFKTILSSEGHEITLAKDGKEGYKQATAKVFDIVLTDLYMPELTGIELTKKLRQLNSYKGIPILIVSTEGATDKKAEGRAAGANGWVVKPITKENFIPNIERLLN